MQKMSYENTLKIFLLIFFLSISPVNADHAPCNIDKNHIFDGLTKKFNEHPIFIGITDSGDLFQIYGSENHRTWTIIVVTAGGMTCMKRAGKDWWILDFEEKM